MGQPLSLLTRTSGLDAASIRRSPEHRFHHFYIKKSRRNYTELTFQALLPNVALASSRALDWKINY